MPEEFNPYRKWLGIPLKDQPAHHYRLLGIAAFESDLDVIEHAADRQMAHIRTFQSGEYSRHSQEILNKLAAAKLCLFDPDKKKEYDTKLRVQLKKKVVAKKKSAPPIPPPKPSPQDATINISSIPVPTASSKARSRSKKGWWPIVMGTISLLAIAGISLLVVKMVNKQKDDLRVETPSPSEEPDTTVTNPPPEKVINRNRYKPPGENRRKPLDLSSIPEEQRFRYATRQAYKVMARRDSAAIKQATDLADKVKHDPDEIEEVELLFVLKTYLSQFWKNVQKGVETVEADKEFSYREESYSLTSRKDEIISYTVNNIKFSSSIKGLSAKHAVAFAAQAGEKETSFKLQAAAFLSLDGEGDRDLHRTWAAELWTEAAKSGHVDKILAVHLLIDDEELEKYREGSGADEREPDSTPDPKK